MRKIIEKIEILIDNIKTLISWIPVIWNDKQFDFIYIYVLLNKKFELMEKHMLSEYYERTSKNKYIQEIKILKLLTDRILNFDYFGNALTKYTKKYGEIKIETEPVEGMPFNRVINRETPEQRIKIKKACIHAKNMREQDKNMLFDCMERWIQNFWD